MGLSGYNNVLLYLLNKLMSVDAGDVDLFCLIFCYDMAA